MYYHVTEKAHAPHIFTSSAFQHLRIIAQHWLKIGFKQRQVQVTVLDDPRHVYLAEWLALVYTKGFIVLH